MSKRIFSPGLWYPVNYSGKWNIEDTDNYGGKDLLCYEDWKDNTSVTEELAENNAILMAAAPKLLKLIKDLKKEMFYKKRWNLNSNEIDLFDRINALVKQITVKP